jgi:hypothetical protein
MGKISCMVFLLCEGYAFAAAPPDIAAAWVVWETAAWEWKGCGAESAEVLGAGPPLNAPVEAAIAATSGGGEDEGAEPGAGELALLEEVLGVMAVLPLFSSISIVTRMVSPQARIA